jgi:hypothetical protein
MMVRVIERVARHDGAVSCRRARQTLRHGTARSHQQRQHHEQQDPDRFHLK